MTQLNGLDSHTTFPFSFSLGFLERTALKTAVPPTFTFDQATLANLSKRDQRLFEQFGKGARVELPFHQIHHAFEAQVAADPTAVAAEHLGNSITYGELNQQANRLAYLLRDKGVSAGDNVCLFIKRSIPMLVGILATLKLGAAYVPQDAGVAPESVLSHVIKVTRSTVILTLSHFAEKVPVPEGHTCLAIDEVMKRPYPQNHTFDQNITPDTPVSRDNHCFILFTSGTTGNPNGVQVTHGNVCNILLTAPGNLSIRPGMRVGQILSVSFDMAAWEILGCLGHGATLVIRGKDFEPVVQSVDVIISTPTILSSFDANQCQQVKTVAVAGEPCPRPLADKWSAFCTFYNSCGPTETTIINTAQNYRSDHGLTIGAPTPNNTVYVLDENRQPLPIGEVGEMWAGGDCVTAGYLGNPELTEERYAPDPFLGNGRVMFRTRDLGRWTADGELEHYGRTDDQVKVRGFRVELDSVSAALELVEQCKRAVTLKLDDRHLVAFVSPNTVSIDAAKQAISDLLPYYCVPKFILPLPELPRTARGKIDKRGLMEMAEEHDKKELE